MEGTIGSIDHRRPAVTGKSKRKLPTSSGLALGVDGERYGWAAKFLEVGELLFSQAAFPTRTVAVEWAEKERRHGP
jgi:hypothetical protein